MPLPQYAEIAINVPVRRRFHYHIPEPIRAEIGLGKRVLVPFGKRTMKGYCVGFVDEPDVAETKDIIKVVDNAPVVDAKMLELTRWMATYYHCSWGEALQAVVPGGVRHKTKLRTISVPKLRDDIEFGVDLWIERLRGKSPKQARVLRFMRDHPDSHLTSKELAKVVGSSIATIRALKKQAFIKYEHRTVEAFYPDEAKVEPRPKPELNPAQAAACERIYPKLEQRMFGVTVLHGVTGSGKTEVYLRVIEHALDLGRGAIVLVPEISLTPQTILRFKERFEAVSVLHSHLTAGQAAAHWADLRSGRSRVVVGARSAIFAPVADLGVIVIDEEHESSFKQDKAPRYHARDVAIMRAQAERAQVILGSATPSLESYHNTRTGKFDLIRLPHRIGNRPLPPVSIVDMRREAYARHGFHVLSRRLEKAMRDALGAGRQVILFLNRRGHSTYIHCQRCGFVLKCRRCDIALTYHSGDRMAICHYCNSEVLAPDKCPDCGMGKISYFGMGTQKVEEEVAKKFPEYVCARMDSDTMRGRRAHEKTLARFVSGEVHILLGTQMIAKGLDIANVAVVGVVCPDSELALPDFRATERAFQHVVQAAGRSGRADDPGRVILQTWLPEHYSIIAAARHDYLAFAKKELDARQPLGYPPFNRMVRLLLRGKKQEQVQQAALDLAGALRAKTPVRAATVIGPAPAPIAQIKGMFRWQILLRAPRSSTLHKIIQAAERDLAAVKPVLVVVDFDPLDML